MAIPSLIITLLFVVGITTADYICNNITVPLSLSATNGVFGFSTPQSNIDVTNFILDSVMPERNITADLLSGYTTISGTYTIQGTFCRPATPRPGQQSVVQILTHGIGFDRSYWDLTYRDPDYSYIISAVDKYGYSTFAWDRLGIGESQHGDPLKEIQATLELAALVALTQGLRAGSIQGVSQRFDKVVHVGHSFGSILSYALTRDVPDISDGLVLTGYAGNGTFIPYFLLGGNFVSVTTTSLSSKYSAGYFACGNPSGVQTNFFARDHFDQDILPFAYATAQPVTVGELLTIGSIGAGVNRFSKPVMIITGDRDLPFCGGNCSATGGAGSSIPAIAAKASFPNTTPTVNMIEGGGHALNMDNSHSQVFTAINDWLNSQGFGGGARRPGHWGGPNDDDHKERKKRQVQYW
jgi:pimeloyl-ACP methyl ester carboxylesterase